MMKLLNVLMMLLIVADAIITRSTNSVDIQLCASGVLADKRDAFEAVLAQRLRTELGQTAFLETMYTDRVGDICFRYVYQAPNPDAAVVAFKTLDPQGVWLVAFTVQGTNAQVNCSLAVAQWSGYSLSSLGVPLPEHWTLDALVLWGSCAAGGLALCLAAACCYCLRTTDRKDDEALARLVRTDRQILSRVMARHSSGRRRRADDEDDDDY